MFTLRVVSSKRANLLAYLSQTLITTRLPSGSLASPIGKEASKVAITEKVVGGGGSRYGFSPISTTFILFA